MHLMRKKVYACTFGTGWDKFHGRRADMCVDPKEGSMISLDLSTKYSVGSVISLDLMGKGSTDL